MRKHPIRKVYNIHLIKCQPYDFEVEIGKESEVYMEDGFNSVWESTDQLIDWLRAAADALEEAEIED